MGAALLGHRVGILAIGFALLLTGCSPSTAASGDESKGALSRFWGTEIARFDNRPITIGTIALGAILLVMGFWLARRLSSTLGRRILPRVGVDTGAATTFQRVIFYVLLLVVTLIVMNIVNVPLTVFTVVGGAIAIGVGFGAQNIINNFISGWILLAERQVNIDDLVEVEGTVGFVRSIGARCTHVRRSDGIDLLIPNSLMLERTVVNWTLTDADIRTLVRVGVVYGSPVEKVVDLIRTTVREHDKILSQPEPVIIFEDFGDNALVFDVYFWVHTSAEMELRIVRSDVRFTLEKLLTAAGIVIAFPQRDVHLDASAPIDVRMLQAPGEGPVTVTGGAPTCSAELLGSVDLLRSLPADELTTLAAAARRRELEADDAVVRQGEPGESLFVVEQGLLRVSVASGQKSKRVAQVLPGEMFGEMSLLTGEPRSATVTAATSSVVYEIDHDMLAPILQNRPDIVRKLSVSLARRKAHTEERVRQDQPSTGKITQSLATDLRRRIQRFFGMGDNQGS